MIRCCTCSGGSSSLLVNHKHSEGSKTCKSCGGKLSLDGRGALSTSMLSTIGLELSKVIDPRLTWKTTSKGRQRAVRRARTSFTGGNKKKLTSTGSKETEDLTDKDSNRTSDMAVSEFEKLGVSVLGRRFSDTLESVPIKKRRFLLTRSPSPPLQSSSHSDDSDQIWGVQSATCKEAASNTKDGLPLDINSDAGFELGQERSFVDEKTNLEDLSENHCDFADFSGISMLAAAACNSNVGGDATNDEDSVCREPKSEENEEKIHKEVLDGKTQTPQELSTKLVMPGEESKVIKVAGLCSLDTPMRSSFDDPDKTRMESSSRDVKLHWDLNTVMDAWESNNIDILNSESHDDTNFVDVHSKKLGSVEPQIGSADSRCASEHTVNRDLGDLRYDNCALEDIKVQEKPELSCNTSIADHNEGSASFSHQHGDSVQEDHKLEDSLVSLVGVAEKAETLRDQENRILIKGVSSPVRGAPIPACDSSLGTGAARGEIGAGFDSVVEAEFSHPPLVRCEKARFEQTPACKPHNAVDQIPELVHQGNIITTSATDLDEHVIYCSPTDVHKGPGTEVWNQAEKHSSLHADSGNGTTDQCSEVNCLAEQSSSVMVYRDICNDMKNTSDVSGEIVHTNAVEKISSTFESHVFSSQVLPDHDELSIGSAHAGEHETTDADMKLQDNKFPVLMDKTLKTIEVDSCVNIDSEFAACSSPTMKPDMVVVPSLNDALNSNGVHMTYGDGYGTSSGQVALEDHSDCDYYSDASQVDIGQPTGMEKVEFLGDNDYQYEDGEFRESFVNRWGEDGPEDGETEYVDYGSDNRETDIFEDVSDFHASVSLHVDGVEGKTGLSDVKCNTEYEAQARMGVQDVVSLPPVTCLLDAGSAKEKDVGRKLERDAEDVSVYGGVITKVGENQFLDEGVASRKAGQLATFRMKTSGWDRLPVGDTDSSRVLISGVDSARRNTDAALGTSNVGEPFRRAMQSPPRRDITSRVGRAKPSDSIHRKDKLYDRSSRPNHTDLDSSRGERDTGAPRLNGRGGSSLHMHGRGKPERWAGPHDHCGPNQHDPHGCYGPTNFTQPTSKNAAAATVAKLESNGFVVAADGTIFKAGGVRPASQVHRRSTKELLHNIQHSVTGRSSRDGTLGIPLGIGNSRELSPVRHNSIDRSRVYSGRCGPGVLSTGVRERYRRAMPDDSRDVHLPLHHQLPRREHSISPHRRHLHRSRTRSPLRSRTRSPQMHSSTRVRNDSGVNSGPGLHLRGRSPHFNSQLRTQRHRSDYQSDMAEHMVSYAPSSRNHNSPAHASRWVDGRKGLPEHVREQEPDRFSRRSPPSQVFLQNKRLDLIDSPGRTKTTNEYHRSMDYGTFPDDFDGEYDGPGDSRRGFGNRYEMLHPVRQYSTDGNTKSFRYDAGNDYRVHNTRPRSSEFQRRVIPREFNRGIGNQLGDSPRRVTEEKSSVRYPRDGKHNAGFKSFGVRDRDDNMTPRRRPPL